MSFAIKKVDDDILFAESFFNPDLGDDLTKYNSERSSLQIISNKGYIVLYYDFYITEMNMLNILLEKLLNKIDRLSIDSISEVLIKPLSDFLSRFGKLYLFDNKEEMKGNICIIGDDNAFLIRNNFSIEEQDRFLDCQDSTLLALDNVLGNPSPLDLIRVKAKADVLESFNPIYTIHYGSLNSKKITLENQKGDSIQIDKEALVCHW